MCVSYNDSRSVEETNCHQFYLPNFCRRKRCSLSLASQRVSAPGDHDGMDRRAAAQEGRNSSNGDLVFDLRRLLGNKIKVIV